MIYAENMLICLFVMAANVSTEHAIFYDFDVRSIETHDAKISLHEKTLSIATGSSIEWPGVTLKAPQGRCDLSSREYIAIDVKNTGTNRVEISCRVDNPGADGVNNCITKRIGLNSGEKKTLRISLQRKLPDNLGSKLFGMRGYPGGLDKEKGIDPGNINQLIIFVPKPSVDHAFEISNIRAGGLYTPPEWLSLDESKFFPLIDEYGQFIHKDWNGKIKSPEDVARYKEEESADLAKHAGPDDWDIYGGWKSGPQLKATGYFRAEKYNGKWWLVDPEGRLFWSHGIDCVRTATGATPITDRQHWFKNLPDKSSEFGIFYGKASWAPHGYYSDKKEYETYNFTGANLLRKYGQDWARLSAEISHSRLRSWGMNTIGNWSSNDIYLMRKTPYVATVGSGGKNIEGSEGYWGKFHDVFDPSFKASLQRNMAREKGKSAGDPWCVGYFVDNELSWGDETSLAIAALISPPDQEAKKVFIEDLRSKYGDIKNLNNAWSAQFASWDALMQNREAPNKEKAYTDLTAFYTKAAETYFKTCRDAVKEVAPDNLYLGCRFAWVNPFAVRASDKYCDVISYNFYTREVGNIRLPEGIDKPVIIGEFHFGALDRGMFHTGLQETENQADRARAYQNYVTSALRNPIIVGTHWFQYGDQATTGRGDGENYQIGFLDIVDTPYTETIQASRSVGYSMYKIR